MQLAFLDLPWELLADAYGHLAGDPKVRFLPVRRLGQPSAPAAPSPFRLSLAFMAAAPHGASSLNFEEEEAAIFKATGSLGLDLTVEETGSLNSLSDCLARDGVGCTFDVLHLSCHGGLNPPRLLFEDEVGDPFPVSADRSPEAFGDHIPRLLFLSACETASPEPTLVPLLPLCSCVVSPQFSVGWEAFPTRRRLPSPRLSMDGWRATRRSSQPWWALGSRCSHPRGQTLVRRTTGMLLGSTSVRATAARFARANALAFAIRGAPRESFSIAVICASRSPVH